MEPTEFLLTISIKTIICGDAGVGKTCILQRLAGNAFDPEQRSTIGVDFIVRTFCAQPSNRQYKLQLWDTCGQERFATVTAAYYRGAQVILFVFDLCKKESFLAIEEKWRERAQWTLHRCSDDAFAGSYKSNITTEARAFLVGNKADKRDAREVSAEEATMYAHTHNMSYFETSARDNWNIRDEFQNIVNDLDQFDLRYEKEQGKPAFADRQIGQQQRQQVPEDSALLVLAELESGLDMEQAKKTHSTCC